MKWPFITRARFDDLRTELERTRTELNAAQERADKLWNLMLWRLGGVIYDSELLPDAYIAPRTSEPSKDGSTKSEKPTVHLPRDVRRKLMQFEATQEQEFFRKQGRTPSPEQVAVAEQLNNTANEATKN
jgi:hypothetical protein